MISVLTPSIPERAGFLAECIASVESQIFPDHEHLVGIDEERKGCSWMMNQLAEQAKGEWLLPLADDDLLLPGALEKLLAHSYMADIVYSPPLMAYPASWHFFQEPPLIPSCALIRRGLWDKLGGYDESVVREEDRGMWMKAVEQGYDFVRVEEPLWVYRLHGGNKSYHGGVAS